MYMQWGLVILLNVACVHSKTKMRTLKFGPVKPPAPGEEFDRRHWLKSAMPKREERCSGISQEKATAPNGVTGAACAKITRGISEVDLYPAQGLFNASLERLEVAVESDAEHVIFDFLDVNENWQYRIVLASNPPTTFIYNASYYEVSIPECLIGSGRILVTFSTNDIEIRKEGSDEPIISLHEKAGIRENRRIYLDAAHASGAGDTEWHFYTPCY